MVRVILLAGLFALTLSLSTSLSCDTAIAGTTACCKYCVKGKACGNTCISRRYTCRVGRGCACNASEAPSPLALVEGMPF